MVTAEILECVIRPAGQGDPNRPIDFFISYSPADERWATWFAWQLEAAGYRTLIQAWDFVPGTNFIDFMDRGIRDAAVVVAVLSRSYLKSHYGRMEWQATLRTDQAKLVPVRIEDCELDPLLAPVTYVDLVGFDKPEDADAAGDALLQHLRHAMAGRAKPSTAPDFPAIRRLPTDERERRLTLTREPAQSRRTPVAPPAYPPAARLTSAPRTSVSVLHVPGPRFGRGMAQPDEPLGARELQSRIQANVTRLTDAGAPTPELIVVSGDLTESARPREIDQALTFLTGLRVLLGLEPHRLIVVPGRRDISRAACQAYFSSCEARDVPPQEPFFPKLDHYAELFAVLYQGLDGPVFDVAQPWTLFDVPELRVVIAAMNSTMAASHRPEDDYGCLTEAQLAWFAERLRPFEASSWLRIGVMRHDPTPAGRAGGLDPVLLRDAETFDQLLGRRLNLLLHGQGPAAGPGPAAVNHLDSGLPALPAAGPGRDEIIEVTVDGLRRFSVHQNRIGERAHRLDLRWRAVDGTFSAPAADGLAEGPASVPVPELPRPADPHDLLLERVAEVCAAKYERAKIRRVGTTPPHLLVTTREKDGLNPLRRVGVHVGELTREVVNAFLAHDPDQVSELVYQGPPPPRSMREEAARRGVRLRSFLEFQGLLDLSGYLARQTARLRTDRRYPPDLYVPQRFRELDRGGDLVRDDLVAELMRLMTADHARFVLLLGDFGRGKTFALRELARRLAETTPSVIPILIELRTLDKAHSVDGLVAAHLANDGEELIDLRAFHYMLREGRVVLLFDGFDELVTRVTYDRATEHLDTLLQAAQDTAKIVVTSRTQHFKSHAQVFTALGERVGLLPHRRIIAVEEFTPAQIRTYLVNRYGGDEGRADAHLRLIDGIKNLLDLSQNPRMLSFIADLDEAALQAAARNQRTLSAAALYHEILRFWLRYETHRASGRRGSPAGLGEEDLWHAVTTLAIRLWETGEPYLRLAELTEVAEELTSLADGRLSSQQTAHAVGAGSLLVRNDEGLFGFIHSSVMEWLVANAIAGAFLAGSVAPDHLRRRPLSQLTVEFLCDLADNKLCHAWANEVLADPESSDIARSNAIKVSTRLRTPATADLRGVSLVGEDLSYRDFAEVDFTGSDLTGARLLGTNLTRAVLRGAKLVGARLDEARLAGADLRGADLSRARLHRTDLTGAAITGSSWRRAALINVTGVPEGPELRGAAIAPGSPVDTEFSPAAIGVRHGFHAELGRLPQVLAYSSDGGTLAIGSDDGGVLVCDSTNGLPLRTLHGHHGRVFAVTYGPDFLVTGASDRTVRIWDANTGKPLQVLSGHHRWPWPVVLDPAGSTLVTGDGGGTLRLWSPLAGTLRHELPGGGGFVFSLSMHGQLLAASYQDGSVRLWDLASGASLGELTGAAGSVYRVAFSPDGNLLATAGEGGALRIWDPATGRLITELAGHRGGVYTIAFHPEHRLLASGDTDGGVRIWDLGGGRPRHILAGHHAAIYWVAFDPAGELLVTGDSAGVVHLWDIETGEVRHTLAGHTGSVWPFAFRPDGSQLAISDDQFTTRLWDPATGHCRHTLTGHGRQVTAVQFDATGSTLATSGNDGVVRLWDPVTGRQTQQLFGSPDRLLTLETAVFSPTAPRLATVSNDGRLNLLNLDTGRYERHIKVESAPLWAVAFSPSGDELATANDDDTVRLWYRTTGRLVRTLEPHYGRVRSIAFSDDGSMIATACDDSKIRIWDAASGELRQTLTGHSDRVYAVDFAKGMLASASWDRTARIWDLDSGCIRHVLSRHAGRLWTAAFNPAGDLLATAGDDLVIHLWDPVNGAHLRTLPGHSRRVWSLAFNPAGSLLASGGDDGTARLWRLTGGPPRLGVTLLGLPEGWAALADDGRYKLDGDVAGRFWHVIGMCRFESGELDEELPEVRHVPPDGVL